MELSIAGHFGEWLQGRLGPNGPVALVTVVCSALQVRATDIASQPMFSTKQLAPFWQTLGLTASAFPNLAYDMPLGAGAGASTATLIAYARHAGFNGPPERLIKACLTVEGASDPLMLPDADSLLWASREGRIVAQHNRPPACTVLGGFWGVPERTDPADSAFPDVADLVESWATFDDLNSLAAIASASASRCTSLRGPADPMTGLAKSLGALGQIRAHTGSARGLVFPFGAAPKHGLAALAEAGLTAPLSFDTGAV